MDLQLTHVEDVFLKLEATEGTDATCAGTDTIQLLKPATITFGAEQMNPRDDLHNQVLDIAQPLSPAAKYAEITMVGQIRWLGSAYSASAFPEIHSLLQAFGFSATFSVNKWIYDTASTSLKTATIYGFRGTAQGNFVKHVITAARGKTLTIKFPAGQPAEFTAVIRGIFNQPTDVANLVPTYQTAAPPLFEAAGGSFSLGSFSTGVVRDTTITIDSPLQARLSANVADALAGYQQTKRTVTFEASFEAGRVSDYDLYTQWKTAAGQALAIALGSASNNKLAVAASTATIQDAPLYKDENGLWLYGVKGICTPEGTNRMNLQFTA